MRLQLLSPAVGEEYLYGQRNLQLEPPKPREVDRPRCMLSYMYLMRASPRYGNLKYLVPDLVSSIVTISINGKKIISRGPASFMRPLRLKM